MSYYLRKILMKLIKMNKTTKNTVNILNGDIFKERSDYYEKSLRQTIRAIIKKIPRNILIDILKQEKIIERDWCANGEKYNLK